ncbi:sporulation and spore germination [Anaerotignum neopropionicum]|uniref:Sporulation and spore germination n=1 Tax=Anaerotignum neopropionicum TaxID=36847 RepID=A0A136WER8_9FIRM|nr:GerMN domain-containing protein [Anaerotignum neopropionicum]KXL53028.1 sporulation and spore germination [Anaerotignum neopropionicum]
MARQKKVVIFFMVIILGLLLVVPGGLFIKEQFFHATQNVAEIYYMGASGKMKAFEIEIQSGDKEDMINAVLDNLRSGIKTDGIKPTIPEGLEVNSVQITDQEVTIDFSSAYFDMERVDEVICRSSIVWSLTSLEFLEAVVFTVEGVPLQSKDDEAYGAMNRQNVLIDPIVSATTTEYAILKLYFSNSDASDLIVEDRVVEVNANQPKERTILEQLIAGPKEEGHFATIPPETKIMDVTTTSDGVCYVNLSQEFVTKHNGGSAGELLTIYSIVNSLAEMENVGKVQFLIEGEKVEAFKGHVDFSTPFVPVKSLKTVNATQ